MSDLQVLVRDVRGDVELISEMHKLRYRVFKERLNWDVSVAGGMEIDNYDILSPTYLLVINRRELIGSARLLPTTGPNMLANTFDSLLENEPAPRARDIWESSRFCIDIPRAEAELRTDTRSGVGIATHALLAGMAEFALANRIRRIVTVTDLIVERIVNKAGWPLKRIGTPHQIGVTKAVATYGEVSPVILANIRAAAGFTGPMLREQAVDLVARRA